MMLAQSIPPSLLGASISTSGPGVVFLPVVNLVAAFLAVDKPDLNESTNECAFLTLPICRQFDVFPRHAGKIAVRVRLSGPQK